MYILGTDHIGILQRQRGPEYDRLSKKLATIPATDIFVTIVSFHEQINGWTKYIKGTRDQTRIVAGYLKLEKIISDFAVSQVLPYSPAASEIFEGNRSQFQKLANRRSTQMNADMVIHRLVRELEHAIVIPSGSGRRA